jgi:light-regulated signal transduction histidine kinase (bacteriophytochrome)
MENIRSLSNVSPIVTKEGRERQIEWYARGLEDAQGNLIGLVSIGQDITERLQAEEKIRQLNAELELKVKEVTRQRVELEAANKELESFSYSVSHDLRSPLRGVSGFCRALEEDYSQCLDGQGLSYLHKAQESARQMAELIDALLGLSRMMRTEMHRNRVDLSSLARQVADDLQKSEPARQVDFVIEPGLSAHGDRAMLRAVLTNLLGNAWKFTGKIPQAHIEFGALPQAQGCQVFFVRDNGAGFDRQYAHKLFGAFQRLHGVREFPGTGIGLATVQRIVQRHGGRVWAEGAVNQGATFYFTLEGEAENEVS